MTESVNRRRPQGKSGSKAWAVAAASLVFPGLGQFFNRQILKGLIWLAFPLLFLGIELESSHWGDWWKLQGGQLSAVAAPQAATPSAAPAAGAAADSDDLYGSSTPASPGTVAAQPAFEQKTVYPDYKASPQGEAYVFRDFGGFFTRGLWGLFSLGSLVIDQPYAGQKIELFNKVSQWLTADNSIQLMGNGLLAATAMAILILVWVLGILDAFQTRRKTEETGQIIKFEVYAKNIWQTAFAYIASAPALLMILFFTVIPFIFTFLLAFTNYTYKIHLGQNLVQWVGFETFRFLAVDPAWLVIFGQIFAWTVFWALMSSFTVFGLGFINAMIVESPLVRGRKFWRGLLIIPWALPQLIALMVFKNVFDKDGLMNQFLFSSGLMDSVTQFLYAIGLEGRPDSPIFWFQPTYNGALAKAVVILVNLWFGAPYHMMMIIGILSSIPKDIYEAVRIDGASKSQQFKAITLPLVLASTVPVLIMTFSFNFNNFGAVYFLTGGGPAWNMAEIPQSMQIIASALPGQTDILISWIYKLSFTKDFEQFNVASVYSILIFVIVGGFAVFNMMRSKSFNDEGDLE